MLLLCEIAVRIFFPQGAMLFPRGLFTADSPAGCYGFTPNFHGLTYDPDRNRNIDVSINRLGFRGNEPQSEGRYRLMILGDSFTAALNCPFQESFPERAFVTADSLGIHVEMLAVGVPGYCAREQYKFLSHWGDSLQPECIILQLYPGNDLAEASSIMDYAVIDGYLVDRKRSPHAEGWMRSWLLRSASRSHLVRLVYRTGRKLFVEKPEIERYAWDEETEKESRRSFYATQFTLGLNDPEVEEAWENLSGYVSLILQWSKERNIPLFGLVMPDRVQFDPVEWERFCRSVDENPDSLSVDRCYDIGRSVFDSLDIKYLDLQARFREESNPVELYGIRDAHLSPAGHELVGRELANQVCRILQK